MPYITADSLRIALDKLHGTADHMLKIWWTLKQMGMVVGSPVEVTTGSPTPSLQRLFSFGHPEGDFFIPFAHTPRFKKMDDEAGRSIIQTTIRRWLASGSVVRTDPTDYLDIEELPSGTLQVKPKRNYPMGLGFGRSGFALEDNIRVTIPDISFVVWYYRKMALDTSVVSREDLRKRLAGDLLLSPAEMELVLVPDEGWIPTFQDEPLSDNEIYTIVTNSISARHSTQRVFHQTFEEHVSKVRTMVTITSGPEWLNTDPRKRLKSLIDTGAKAILLYGPPRTSKTYAVDELFPRTLPERETIQIHNGWGYEDLMVGLRPMGDRWSYQKGPLYTAIHEKKKKYIVLEEINRTEFSQAIGEVFSLLEEAYRGEAHKIPLRDGDDFFIPADVLIICTMNTLDRSTEEIDDALFGRMAAIEFPPRVEDLHEMLERQGIPQDISEKLRIFFSTIQQFYPLGHAYFASFKPETVALDFYLTRVRPVLQKHLQNYRDDDLKAIDEKADQLFNL